MKVSIIVPVYNSEEYLTDCLNSLIGQTLEEIEIIVVDDASIDNGFQILQNFASKYPNKVKIYRNLKNVGQSETRNIGLNYASGEYIGFIDSDDYVHPEMYETMYNGAINNDYPEVVTTGITFVKNSSFLNKFNRGIRRNGKLLAVLDDPEEILDQSPSVCNKIFRKDVIGDLKFLTGKMWEDIAFSFSAMFNANKILVFINHDYYYRKSMVSGVSAQGYKENPHLLDIFAVADEITKQTEKTGRYAILRDQIKFLQIAVCSQRMNEILDWKISEDKKEELLFKMLSLITEKYGDFRKLDKNKLSSRVGIMEIELYEKYMEILSLDETEKLVK